MFVDPFISLLPLLFIVLIFLTYLNMVENKRTKNIDEKLGLLADHLKTIAEKLGEKL
jgi:hypothetical protein